MKVADVRRRMGIHLLVGISCRLIMSQLYFVGVQASEYATIASNARIVGIELTVAAEQCVLYNTFYNHDSLLHDCFGTKMHVNI